MGRPIKVECKSHPRTNSRVAWGATELCCFEKISWARMVKILAHYWLRIRSMCIRSMYTYSHQCYASGRLVNRATLQFKPNCDIRLNSCYVYLFASDWKLIVFHYIVYKTTRWRDLMLFLKIYIFMQHKYRHFLTFSTRPFNYYKLKCGEYLCIAHELCVKIVNFDINYLCIGTVEKFEINLAYK